MKIEIKNLKHSEFASKETYCFEASIYVDGTRSFIASNDGQGGCHKLEAVKGKSVQILQEVRDWVAAQPKVETEYGEFDDDLDFYISRLVDREISRRKLRSLMSRRQVYYDTKQGLLMSTPGQVPANNTTRVYLKDIDSEKALDFFVASRSSSDMATIYHSLCR